MKQSKFFGSDGFSCHCQTAQEHYKNMKEDYDYQVLHNFPREQQEETYKQLCLARLKKDEEHAQKCFELFGGDF